jgi:hypothetical protein
MGIFLIHGTQLTSVSYFECRFEEPVSCTILLSVDAYEIMTSNS